jgi:hypothetical protein
VFCLGFEVLFLLVDQVVLAVSGGLWDFILRELWFNRLDVRWGTGLGGYCGLFYLLFVS